MSVQAISAPLVLAADGLRRDHAVLVDDAMILDIVPQHAVPPGLTVTAHAHGLLAPGFVDVQVNGGGGVLFNDAPTVDTIRTMAAAHRRYGTTAMLPTLISDDWDKTVQALEAVDAAIAEGVPGIVGIHLEGPFLNPAKKGIHDAGKFRVLDDAAVAFLCRPRRGAVLMTLAPERAELAHIRALAEAGVVLAAGHSLARYEEIEAAVRAGLRGVTHLFNAMSPLESRAPGLVGAALDLPALWAGIIADGFHVHPAALRLAVRAKGVERVMLVTDAMATVGADIASFMLGDVPINLRDGRLSDARGVLAGSNLDMASAVRYAARHLGVSLADAIAMASATPAAFLRLGDRYGAIAPGHRAHLLFLDDDSIVRRAWIDGQRFDVAAQPASSQA